MSNAQFDLLDIENGTDIFVPEGSNFRNLVHAKALLILNWQQEQEIEKKIPDNLTLKLIVDWLNCSSWDPFLHHFPKEYYNFSKSGKSLNLQDFNCVPNSFRSWCIEDPGRNLHFQYVLEEYLGHTIDMKFICDPGIREIQEEEISWIYGVMTAMTISLGILGVSKVRKDRELSNFQCLREAPESNELQNRLPEQDKTFLTVPQRVRIRTKDSGKEMMEARKTLGPNASPTVIPEFLKLDRRKRNIKIPKERIPKIYVYEPEN